MPTNSWTEEEIKFLKLNYGSKTSREIQKVINKKRSTIKEYARRHGLLKSLDAKNASNRLGSFESLLQETPEVYYWIGFIFADGHLSKNGRLAVTSSWDKDHLELLAKFLGTKVTTNKKASSPKNFPGTRKIFYAVCLKDITRHNELRGKFQMHNRKTYNPPNLNFLKEDWKFLSFLAGFIDGDGSIHKARNITVENHISWTKTHSYIKERLLNMGINSSCSITSSNLSHLYISKDLYYLIIKRKLPLMKRKWNK